MHNTGTSMSKIKNTNIISLFSGGGGLDLGFQKAGFDLLWANEYDKTIWATHKLNFPLTELNQNSIANIDEHVIPECIGMIGGPPCQSFSEAGAKKGTADPRGQLFWDYIRVLVAKKPLFFVAENVSGLLSDRHKHELEAFLTAFDAAGYNVDAHLYKASDYGVPQDRERLIFVGYRKDLNKTFTRPTMSSRVVLKDILHNMPEPLSTKAGQTNVNPLLHNHEYMTGGFSSMFLSRNRVRSWDETSFTILATARQTPLHPQAPKMLKIGIDQFSFVEGQEHLYRRLSVRECARIQTFPDDYIFLYDKIETGYKMVGNAVPVELARQIATSIKNDLNL
jgi:DNA (cytosine-5)-methyltransferase 1